MAKAKVVTVCYGVVSNRPHNRNIEKAIEKWSKKGYQLTRRQDQDVGCLTLLFTLGWARGRTQLTWVRE